MRQLRVKPLLIACGAIIGVYIFLVVLSGLLSRNGSSFAPELVCIAPFLMIAFFVCFVALIIALIQKYATTQPTTNQSYTSPQTNSEVSHPEAYQQGYQPQQRSSSEATPKDDWQDYQMPQANYPSQIQQQNKD